MKVWLPSQAIWNGRIRAHIRGRWIGDQWVGSLTHTANAAIGITGVNAQIVADDGFVTVLTDGGYQDLSVNEPSAGRGMFAMNPDGTINTTLMADLSHRSTHEMAVKTKALLSAYYGKPATRSHLDGCSSGARAAYQSAQMYPDDFDGILAEAPSIDQTQLFPSLIYGHVVMQRDLVDQGGAILTKAQLDLASSAAVKACDRAVTGQPDGYVTDFKQCKYDPVADQAVLCASDGGTNTTPACLTKRQAGVINKMWYGVTADGSAPSPADDNGFTAVRPDKQIWLGRTLGTKLDTIATSTKGVPAPFEAVMDRVALNTKSPSLATSSFVNDTGSGQGGWKALSYPASVVATTADKAASRPICVYTFQVKY